MKQIEFGLFNMSTNRKFLISIVLLFVLWIIVALIAIFTGTYSIGPFEAFEAFSNSDELSKTIFLKIRIPRAYPFEKNILKCADGWNVLFPEV